MVKNTKPVKKLIQITERGGITKMSWSLAKKTIK